MKSNLLVIISFLFLGLNNNTIAQNSSLFWAKRIGGGMAQSASLVVDNTGNVYTTGFFDGPTDFDPGPGIYNLTSFGSADIFVSKLDSSGNFLWAKQMGGVEPDEGNAITLDATGNVILTGRFYNTADFDPGSGIYNMTSVGTYDIFVLKLDTLGNFLWAKSMGGTNFDFSKSLFVDAFGNIYTTGDFAGTADFDPGSGIYNMASANNSADIFVSKLDALGNFLWAKRMGGSNLDDALSLVVDANGNVYTTGRFKLTADFDPGSGTYNLTSAGGNDIFVSKLNSSGNFLWAQRMGGGSNDVGTSLKVDGAGNIYTVGNFIGTADFDPGPGNFNQSSAGGSDIFVSKLDDSGNFLLALQMGGNEDDEANSLTLDVAGNIYITGYFKGTADFDPGPEIYSLISTGSYEMFFSKLDVSGNFLWAKQIGGENLDWGFCITIDNRDNLIITGTFKGVVDFDPGSELYYLASVVENDIFVVKFFKGDPKVFLKPKIYTSKAILNVGQTQTITGKDFTSGSQINLFIQSSNGDSIPVNTITYLPNGGFSYQLVITSSTPNGEYIVYATDNNTGQTTPGIKFKVNNAIQQNLIVTEPKSVGEHIVNKLTQIRWVDFISNSFATGVSGFVQKRYKIEASGNGGSSWQTIIGNKIFPLVQSNQTKEFVASYAFINAGTYIIKVTDLDNVTNNNTSVTFSVLAASSGGFSHSLEWDKSILPLPSNITNPVGLAADGTSRIIIKLLKDVTNTKTVNSIHASIIDQSGNAIGTELLGKVKPAKITSLYSDEANNANATICDTAFIIPSADPSFSFWLVAPDDFTQTSNSGASERVIKVDFTVTYSDNSTTILTANYIRIVRPPLLMVHGLDGSSESFADLKFNIGNGDTRFKDVIDNRTIWRSGKLPTLIPYGSFETNAVELLGSMDHSFRAIINEMRSSGYASNKVDYVCHSMGGCMARTVINKYSANYYSPKNYNKGFINKLITINTPHNGSPIADLFVDLTPTSGWYWPSYQAHPNGYFVQSKSNLFGSYYIPSQAILDLRAVNGGIRFGTTNVKNHMIGGDIDRYNVPDAGLIIALNGNNKTRAILALFGLVLPGAATGIDAIVNSTNAYISLHYDYPNFLSNSDGVVPMSSQFPDMDINSIPEVEDNNGIYIATNSYGLNRNHLQIKDDIAIGTKVMSLLNSSINSGYFADQIAANPNANGSATYRNMNTTQASDSILSYMDTVHVKIVNPSNTANLYTDSTINIKIVLIDTLGLRKIQLFFQKEIYQSVSRVDTQTYNVKLNSNAIGYNMVLVNAIYDSLGFTIYHTDTTVLHVISLDTLKGFYISPKSQNLNRNQFFLPTYNAVYTTYIGALNDNIDSLTFSIADTNVVKYVDSVRQFVTKDTGTTHIVFNYKGYIDSAFIYVGSPVNDNITTVCNQSSVSFFAGTNDSTKIYQWQVDTANGFGDISPGPVYSGTDSSTLTLTNPPSNWYNYRYRCVISDSIGQTTSQIFTLRFSVTWIGVSDTAWENPTNWSCNVVPDDNTDVYINTGLSRYPKINTNVFCRKLILQPGTSIEVKPGKHLDVTGKDQ